MATTTQAILDKTLERRSTPGAVTDQVAQTLSDEDRERVLTAVAATAKPSQLTAVLDSWEDHQILMALELGFY